MTTPETKYRHAAFTWLSEQTRIHGDVLPRDLLTTGFSVDNNQITLLGPQGIWKPKVFEIPLSITTVITGPYKDAFSYDGYLLYKYRGTDPGHKDNAGLRTAMQKHVPLVYFHNIVKGKYLAIWPVYIVGDDPVDLTFKVSAEEAQIIDKELKELKTATGESSSDLLRRKYIVTTVKQRLHQSTFRERVLQAYREQCAMCRLKHRELLDAAHIIPDSDPEGEPVITNGLSLCKLHHAAFDSNFLGITPDYIIQIREDIRREKDGPMLLHGLQGLHEQKIILPKDTSLQPDKALLDRRYEIFKKAG